MCRLFAYAGAGRDLSAHLAGPSSLRALACDHAEGWGLAAWSGPGAAAWTAKAPGSAEKDPEFARASALRAPRILAHVRKASRGGVRLANTHPFAHGRWAFAHNGTIRGLDEARELARVDAGLLRLRTGETDSEVAFLLFLAELRMRSAGLDASLEEASSVLGALVARLGEEYPGTPDQPTRMNFVAGNGDGFVATRWGHDLSTREGDGESMVGSVPMGGEPGWREVPDRSVLVVRDDGVARRRIG